MWIFRYEVGVPCFPKNNSVCLCKILDCFFCISGPKPSRCRLSNLVYNLQLSSLSSHRKSLHNVCYESLFLCSSTSPLSAFCIFLLYMQWNTCPMVFFGSIFRLSRSGIPCSRSQAKADRIISAIMTANRSMIILAPTLRYFTYLKSFLCLFPHFSEWNKLNFDRSFIHHRKSTPC